MCVSIIQHPQRVSKTFLQSTTQSLYCEKLQRIFICHKLLWKLRILILLGHLSLVKLWAFLLTRYLYHYMWMELGLSNVIEMKDKLQVHLSTEMKLLQIRSAFHNKHCMEIQEVNTGHNMPKTIRFSISIPTLLFPPQCITRTPWLLVRYILEL